VTSSKDERLFILDTNAYLRIADSFHPLISTIFGSPPCKLRVVPDLDRELKRNPRLTSKFHWASLGIYAQDRNHYLRVDHKMRKEIETNLDYLRETARDLQLGTSPVDNFCLAYALAFGAVVITDDGSMTSLATEFDIPITSTIDLLKLMYDEGRASLKEIKDAVAVIEGRDDISDPKQFWKKYNLYFENFNTGTVP
jgi:hypothetical protein